MSPPLAGPQAAPVRRITPQPLAAAGAPEAAAAAAATVAAAPVRKRIQPVAVAVGGSPMVPRSSQQAAPQPVPMQVKRITPTSMEAAGNQQQQQSMVERGEHEGPCAVGSTSVGAGVAANPERVARQASAVAGGSGMSIAMLAARAGKAAADKRAAAAAAAAQKRPAEGQAVDAKKVRRD